MSEKKIKSALDLAMERLDAASGAVQTLSDAQKEKMADIEKRAQAKLAEMDIMHQQNLAEAGGDYGKIMELDEAMKRGRQRIEENAEEERQAVRDED